ncbi:unnamed protein product [Symbiodinium sp. CCMP2592]|nr:unnamed protein product [Symbiodinium sp. CCMP2592]
MANGDDSAGSFIHRLLKEEEATEWAQEAGDEEMLPYEEEELKEEMMEEECPEEDCHEEGYAEYAEGEEEEMEELPAEAQPEDGQPAEEEEEDPELDAKFQGLLQSLQAAEAQDEAEAAEAETEQAAVQEPSKPSRPPPQIAPWHQQKPIGGFTKPREPRGPPPPDVARASKRRSLDLREGHGRLETSSRGAWNVLPPPPPRPPAPASLQGAEVAPGAKVVPPREPGGEANAASASSVGPRPPKGAPPPGLREQKGDGRVVPARKKETAGPAERSANASAALEKAKDLFAKGKKNGDQAFNPPVRWNIAGAKSSNLRESLQKHLAMKKQEELRKHEEKTATKQTTPAEPRPWKESSSAQAAPTPSAPSRPPPSGGSGSAWDSAALRLKATGTTEKDKTDLKNFVTDLQLNDEQVELGLQFLERSKLRSLLAQKDRVLKSCKDPAARIENVRKMIAAADPAADELVRRIDREDRDGPKAAASPAPKTPPKAPPKKVPPPPAKPPPKEILQGAEGAARTLRKAIEEASKKRPPEPKQAPPKQAPQKLWPTEKAHPSAKAPAAPAAAARGSTPPPPPPQGPPPGTAPPPKARPASASRMAAKAPSTPPPAPPAPAPPAPASQPPKPKPSAPSQPAVPPPPPGPPPPPQVMPKAELRPRMPQQGKPQPPKTPPPTIPKAVTFPAAKASPAKMVPPPPKASGAQGRDRSRSRDRSEAPGKAPGEAADDMAAFLRELDPSGQMDGYAARLRSEFGSRAQLRAAVVDETASGLAMVDPAVFEALQMRALGHKLLLVRGLKKLLRSE